MHYTKQFIVASLLFLCVTTAWAQTVEASFFDNNAQSIKSELNNSAFGVPIVIQSQSNDKQLNAEIYGKLPYPFKEVRDALSSPANWCEIVTLNLNIKTCTYETDKLNFYVAGKQYKTPEDAYLINYQYQTDLTSNDELRVILAADKGPLDTKNYRIELRAIPAPFGTYLRIQTAYQSSFLSRVLTSTYLNTFGRHKVGFTVVGTTENGEPDYIKGVNGIVERNVVRYYLATMAFLDTRDHPLDERFSLRSQRWYDLTEQFSRQLHEVDRTEYLSIKQLERQNQIALQEQLNTTFDVTLNP